MEVRGTYRLWPSGVAVADALVELYDADDLVNDLENTTTAADGTWTIQHDFSPGKWWIKITDSENTVVRWLSSRDTVMQGPNSSYDLSYVLASLSDGVCKNVRNEFQTTASSLTSTVQSGAALVHGIVASSYASTALVHSAHEANPRYDRIVLRVTRLGQSDEGKSELDIVQGTAAASPALPALTQSSSVWEYELYEVLVPATSGALTLTDRRTYVGENPLSRPAPLLTNHSSATEVTSFNEAGVLTSVYGFSQSTNNHISDGFFEAYVQVILVGGSITLAAYVDSTATTGETYTVSQSGTYIVPVRVGFEAKGPAGARTFGVAAYATNDAEITLGGVNAFVTQFRRTV